MKIVIRPSPTHGLGVFARAQIRKGERIGRFVSRRTYRNGMHVLWLLDDGGEQGYQGCGRLRYLNHSDRPNSEFIDLDLHALQTIRRGKEITIDYNSNGSR